MNGTKFYPCFMFVMKKELFQDFCAWLFPMLFELEKRLDISEYSEKELRVFGLLGERLYGIYLTRLLAVRPELKSRSRQCLFFQRTQKQEVLQPHFSTRNVAIEMCVRDRIIPYVSVALESLLENADSSWNYDVVLLHSDVKGKTMLQMQRAFSLYSNVHIRFFDMSEYIQGMKWSPVDHVPEQS